MCCVVMMMMMLLLLLLLLLFFVVVVVVVVVVVLVVLSSSLLQLLPASSYPCHQRVSEGGRELVLWSWGAGGLEASGIEMAWGLQGVIGKPGFLLSNLSNIGGGYRFSMVFLYIFPWFNSRDDSHHLAQGEAELLLGRRLRPSSAPASSSTIDVNRDPTLQAVRGCGVLGWLHGYT
jgi:hypothetical protein